LNNLGYFLLQRGERFSEALEMIERAVRVDPTNASYLDSLGWAYFKVGKNDEALKTLREAARLDPTSAAAHEHIGDVLQKMGKAAEARESWLKARQFVSAETDSARLKGKIESLK
jgi:Flp pilus assembly protein TadD